jgi:serine/threonine protein kinase
VRWLSDAVVDHLREVATRPELPADRYVLLRPIGRGGMGAVYAARDGQLEREVAIKVSAAPAPRGALDERLRREARVLARLEHPGIVPVHDAGLLADGRAYYVMKLVRGETLAAYAFRLGDEAALLGVFERVAQTIAFAHARGVVHRDLKPSNIMVGSFGEVLVLDWGVAKLVGLPGEPGDETALSGPALKDQPASPAVAAATASGTRIGTPGYMAPEQQRGDSSAAGPESDVYSLGALLFWLLTGATPPESRDDAARALASGARAVPRRLRAIVLKCLAPGRGDRYADAGALLDDLSRYRAGAPVSAHRDTSLERAGQWFARYRVFILLLLAYLLMRAIFVVLARS